MENVKFPFNDKSLHTKDYSQQNWSASLHILLQYNIIFYGIIFYLYGIIFRLLLKYFIWIY